LIPRKRADFVQLLFDLQECGYKWLRGESRDFGRTGLTPTSLRTGAVAREPAELIQKLAPRVDPGYLNDPLVKLALQQHYGEPTRLLDWTENKLAATFFALGEGETLDQPGFIYCLNVDRLRSVAAIPGFSSAENILFRSAFPPANSSPLQLRQLADAIAMTRPRSKLLALVRRLAKEKTSKVMDSSMWIDEHLANGANARQENPLLQFSLLGLPYPVTIKKNFPRIEAQTGSFTIHSGFHQSAPEPMNLRLLSQLLSTEGFPPDNSLAQALFASVTILQDLLAVVVLDPNVKREFANEMDLEKMKRDFYPSDDEWLAPESRERLLLGEVSGGMLTVERDTDGERWTITVKESSLGIKK
jgi:hypothetical protein